MKIKKKIVFFFIISIVFAQDWRPYHIEDLLNHQNISIDFENVDSIARSKPLPNHSQRNNLTHQIIGYLPYWEYAHYPNLDYELLTQINFFSAELDAYGNVINDHNWNNLYIVSFAHDRNVKVKLCATLFGQNSLETLLSDSLNRQNAIENLLELVINKNADGVDIDFELLPYSQRDNLVTFMQELSEAFHIHMDDPIITMATPAVDWSNAWDYNSLAYITDGLFIMGYNYFYAGSSNAGPVSPLGGYFYDLEFTLEDYLTKTQGQTDKIILGLPYYGYDWSVIDNMINSETTDAGIARIYSEAEPMAQSYGYTWNNISNTAWFSYQINNWYQCWYDDSLSLSHKYQFAIDNQLSGVGLWALGYDEGYNELWGALSDKFISIIVGDLNSDNEINILDVVLLVNIILGNNDIITGCDLNNDEEINILDVIQLINIILN